MERDGTHTVDKVLREDQENRAFQISGPGTTTLQAG